MKAIERFSAWLTQLTFPWWAWPALLVAMAIFADTSSWLLHPLGESWVAWPSGAQFGEECASITVTGYPCPQCGMTRSWVHGIRGNLTGAMRYNIAGFTLWIWINAGGLVGLARLLTKNPEKLKPPTVLIFAWTVFWLVPLYIGGWVLRMIGYFPLP